MRPKNLISLLLACGLASWTCGGGRSGTGIGSEDLTVSSPASGSPAARQADDASDSARQTPPAQDVERVGRTVLHGNIVLAKGATPSPRKDSLERLSGNGLMSLLWLLPTPAHADTAVQGIIVRVLGTRFMTSTDADGVFELGGKFSGPLTLRFERLEDGLRADLDVNPPRGGFLNLADLVLDGSTAQASPASQNIAFSAVVLTARCAEDRIDVTSASDPSGESFSVDLSSMSISDGAGNALSCTDLEDGTRLDVEGMVQPDGSIGDGSAVTQ